MKIRGLVHVWVAGIAAFGLLGAAGVRAQRAAVPSRIVRTVNDTETVTVRGNVHPLARPANDRGAVADSQPMSRVLLLLQRSAEQEQSLQQLLDAQQTKGSGNFHNWLAPDQFGKQFGPSDADLQAVTDWLTRQGFQIGNISKGRTAIEFSGNVAQVRSAFKTEIRRYVVNGEEHFANATDPQIPAALSQVVAGVVALHNFPRKALVKSRGTYRRNTATGQLTPLFTFGNPANFALGPGDFKTIYNIPNGADGTGQSIAVVGQSNINIQDIRDFRSMFGLPAKDPQIIVNGPDPGLVDPDEGESDLDVEWAGAVAPNANVIFVTSLSTLTDPLMAIGGVDLSALYIIDNNVAPVMSESYGACEAALGTTGNAYYNSMWQQAAAEGITVVVSSGDSGSAGCDPTFTSPNAATSGVTVSGIASTPYNVAAGGTDFDPTTTDAATASNYWNTTSGTVSSALKYMPEITWDDSTCAFNYPAACTSVDQQGFDVVAAGGGPSNCAISSGSACTSGYAKPAYQQGGITINTTGYTTRLIPDISLFSSNGQNGVALVVCQSDANPGGAGCNLNSPFQDFSLVGGTSAATPAFAAIVALVNQSQATTQNPTPRQGNVNYTLYGLAKSDSNYTSGKCASSVGQTPDSGCVFNDVTKGNISVACVGQSPNCSNTTGSGFGVLIYQGNTAAFTATNGYDLATGLGSINVSNLLSRWSSFSRTATTTTLSNATGTSVTSGQAFSVKVSVAPAAATGDVSLTAYASDGTILGSVVGSTSFTLSGGSITINTTLLPPGTANISAYYGGDVTYAASTSALLPVAVSGANQASKTTVGFVTFDANNFPILPAKTGSITAIYGSPYILQILVTPTSGTACTSTGTLTTAGAPCPKGTVTLTDNGSALNDWPIAGQVNATNVASLNREGIAEDQPIQLSAGSHSIQAAFTTGDTNFQSSNSNTLAVTITQASTSTAVTTSPGSITSGQTVTLTALVSTNSNGEEPCGITNSGTVQFTLDGNTISGTVNYTGVSGIKSSTGTASCLATVSTAISGLYPPATKDRKFRLLPWVPTALALLSILFFALALRSRPQTRQRAYVYAALLAAAFIAINISGCGGGGGGGGGGGKSHTIGATYNGDTNYSKSVGTTTITVN